jgi:hypothetical protein
MGFDPAWVAAGRARTYVLTGINLSVANSDAATFQKLPSKYIVTGFRLFDASVTPVAATLGLRTAAAGSGNLIVATTAVTGLNAATVVLSMTIALTGYQTAPALFVRTTAANSAALTVSAALSILDLTP